LTDDDTPPRVGGAVHLAAVLPAGVLEGIDWEARDREVAAERARLDAELEAKRLLEVGRDLAERGAPVDDIARVTSGGLEETEALVAVQAAIAGGSKLFVLGGPPGIGKTTAACYWLIHARAVTTLVRTRPALFIRAGQLARWDRFGQEAMRDLERARALVVDDLGVEFDDTKGAFRSLLDEVVDARYAASLPTLLTTNLAGPAFKERYHERIADRVRGAGGFIALRGESMRARR
jgi:DNA replication protein DnaC